MLINEKPLMAIEEEVGNLAHSMILTASCWRLLHMMVTNYGNHPTGQLLVALTLSLLHGNGHNPTVEELCKTTGIPKSTVSRYVSWQLSNGLIEEVIDPKDRRHRQLHETEKGAEMKQQFLSRLDNISREVGQITKAADNKTSRIDPLDLLAQMEALTNAAKTDPA